MDVGVEVLVVVSELCFLAFLVAVAAAVAQAPFVAPCFSYPFQETSATRIVLPLWQMVIFWSFAYAPGRQLPRSRRRPLVR